MVRVVLEYGSIQNLTQKDLLYKQDSKTEVEYRNHKCYIFTPPHRTEYVASTTTM